MFIAILFTIAKIQNQLRCPSTEGGIMKVRYMYTVEYYSSIKKIGILSFAAK
jgi:hypothetical protein